jgi:hypothetical protein
MARLSYSKIVLTASLSLWMLDGGHSRIIRGNGPPAPRTPPYLVKILGLLKDKLGEPAKDDDEEKKLLKARYSAAEVMIRVYVEHYDSGSNLTGTGSVVGPATFLIAMEKLRDARLELGDKKDRVAVLEVYLEVAKATEEVAKKQYGDGRIGRESLAGAQYARLTAELQLLRAERKLKDSQEKKAQGQ